MAVEDAQTPCRQHEDTHAGEDNAHHFYGEFALGAFESGCDEVNEKGRCQNSHQNQHRHGDGKNRPDDPGNPSCLRFIARCQQAGINGDKGR